MVLMAHEDKYDVAVLCSADSDLVPAVEGVLKVGKKVELIRWQPEHGYGQQLKAPGKRLWTHQLKSSAFEWLRDDHNYAHGPRQSTIK